MLKICTNPKITTNLYRNEIILCVIDVRTKNKK